MDSSNLSRIGDHALWEFVSAIDFPALIMIVFLVAAAYILFQMQKRSDFDFANMLKDDVSGKESGKELAKMVAIIVSAWVMMYVTMKGNADTVIKAFFIYLAIWSGSSVVGQLITFWAGTKGFNLGGQNGAVNNVVVPSPAPAPTIVAQTAVVSPAPPSPTPAPAPPTQVVQGSLLYSDTHTNNDEFELNLGVKTRL